MAWFGTVAVNFRRAVVLALGIIGVASGGAWAAAENPRVAAERTMQAVSATPANAQLAAESLANADAVLKRAGDARTAGDHEHAALLEAVALEWAQTGRDLVRAAQAEAEADELAKQAAEVEERLARARALLEQTVARRGRAKARLKAITASPALSPAEGQP